MTVSGTTDACLCLSEAYHDAGFNDWAVAHGLGFDFYNAVKVSGWGYWVDHGDAYQCGRPMPHRACQDALVQRDMLAARVVRYYGAYLKGVPPESARGKAVVCGCGVTPVIEDDEL